MADYLQTAIARICLMEQAAITKPDGTQPAAYEHPFVKATTYPYWLNWAGPVVVEKMSDDTEHREHDIVMRLVLGVVTQDYDGAIAERLNDYVADVLDYFNARPTLKRTNADAEVGIAPGEGAFIGNATGIQVGGDNTVYCDFTLTVPFLVGVERVY